MQKLEIDEFMLSIVLLPVTNGLYGVYRLNNVVALSHLTLIAALNALLWLFVLKSHPNNALHAIAVVPVVVFVCGLP